jgi:hypothetical protein
VSERWIPLLAAVVGLLGGMGGALVGGWVANEGQQQRFEEEQEAQARELRVEAFAEFLQSAASINQGAPDPDAALARLDAAEAKVGIFANTDTRNAAAKLGEAVRADKKDEDYDLPRENFVEAAKAEVAAEE